LMVAAVAQSLGLSDHAARFPHGLFLGRASLSISCMYRDLTPVAPGAILLLRHMRTGRCNAKAGAPFCLLCTLGISSQGLQ